MAETYDVHQDIGVGLHVHTLFTCALYIFSVHVLRICLHACVVSIHKELKVTIVCLPPLQEVLWTEEQIRSKVKELGRWAGRPAQTTSVNQKSLSFSSPMQSAAPSCPAQGTQ